MQVCVIKNTEPNKVSIPTSGLIGGLAGYALKYQLPINMNEMDTFFPSKTRQLSSTQVDALSSEEFSILKGCANDEAVALFVKRLKAKTTEQVKHAEEAIKNSSDKMQKLIKDLSIKYNSIDKNTVNSMNKILEASIKDSRYSSIYIIFYT